MAEDQTTLLLQLPGIIEQATAIRNLTGDARRAGIVALVGSLFALAENIAGQDLGDNAELLKALEAALKVRVRPPAPA